MCRDPFQRLNGEWAHCGRHLHPLQISDECGGRQANRRDCCRWEKYTARLRVCVCVCVCVCVDTAWRVVHNALQTEICTHTHTHTHEHEHARTHTRVVNRWQQLTMPYLRNYCTTDRINLQSVICYTVLYENSPTQGYCEYLPTELDRLDAARKQPHLWTKSSMNLLLVSFLD